MSGEGAAEVSSGDVALSPIAAGERIEELDVLRGFALFGVLIVNGMTWFRTNPSRHNVSPEMWSDLGNRIVEKARVALFDMKFITLFSFLFGVGLALTAERAEARGGRPIRFLLRRFFFLFCFGAAHVVLLWLGDILHAYALLGALSLLVLRRKTRTIAITAGILSAIPPIGNTIRVIVMLARGESAVQSVKTAAEQAQMLAEVSASIEVYGRGTWLEITHRRLVDFLQQLTDLPFYGLHIFVLFLLGMLAHRSGILRDPAAHARLLRRFIVFGVVFGLVFESGFIFRPEPGSKTFWSYVVGELFGFFFLASTALGLSYAAALLLLLRSPRAKKWLAPIGKVGRMALTNYLMQSVFNTFIFYGFGLGLHDRLSPLACLPIFVGIYAVQVAWSGPWLARFEYGPAEWLWRTLTYGKAPRMRVVLDERREMP